MAEFAHGVVPWSFHERTKTSSFCRGNPRKEGPVNGKQISFCQIHTKKSQRPQFRFTETWEQLMRTGY